MTKKEIFFRFSKLLRMTYYALANSIITYASICWGSPYKVSLKPCGNHTKTNYNNHDLQK